jgi:hypothetical protein
MGFAVCIFGVYHGGGWVGYSVHTSELSSAVYIVTKQLRRVS